MLQGYHVGVGMKLRRISAVFLSVIGCGGLATKQSDLAGSCSDAGGAPRRDAGGPVCIAPGVAPFPCPAPDAQPDPATWPCDADKDCDVFPTLPICDRRHCSAAQANVTCVANSPNVGGLPIPEVAHSFTGSNGTFADHCDQDGNLVAYQCEMTDPPCDPAASRVPNGCDFGYLIFTGRVIPNQDSPTVDCEGRCRDGRCDGRCPQQGDQITLVGVDSDGKVLIHNSTDGRTYSCTADPAYNYAINFDCARSPSGQSGYVSGPGPTNGDGTCTGKNWGGMAVVVDGVQIQPRLASETCSYLSCSIVPPYSCNF
jgi:hypothetical protein